MEAPVSCLDLSKENVLAVGLRNGVAALFNAQTLASVSKIANHKNPDKDVLSAIKFSPDGSQLAIAYCPPVSQVYLYDISGKPKKTGSCKGSSTRIVTIDFSRAGDTLLSTSIEPLFYKSPNCSRVYVSAIKG